MRKFNSLQNMLCSLNSLSVLSMALIAIVVSPQLSMADDASIIKVEEDWRIEIGTPDSDGETPQIITAMVPFGSTSEYYSLFELNHITLPEYSAGGMQLQLWKNDDDKKSHLHPSTKRMNTVNEVVTFTMSTHIDDGILTIEVANGDSTTWGKFGNQGYLKTSETITAKNLNSYNSNASVTHSRVGFGSNRVKKFVRTEVRYYSAEGLVKKETSETIVTTLGNN